MLESYLTWLAKHRIAVIVASVLIGLTIAAGAARLTVTNDMRAYFSPDNPQLAAFEALENIYEKEDNLVWFVLAKNGDIFNDKNPRSGSRNFRAWLANPILAKSRFARELSTHCRA